MDSLQGRFGRHWRRAKVDNEGGVYIVPLHDAGQEAGHGARMNIVGTGAGHTPERLVAITPLARSPTRHADRAGTEHPFPVRATAGRLSETL
jgi:hypothetical protein